MSGRPSALKSATALVHANGDPAVPGRNVGVAAASDCADETPDQSIATSRNATLESKRHAGREALLPLISSSDVDKTSRMNALRTSVALRRRSHGIARATLVPDPRSGANPPSVEGRWTFHR